MLKYTARVALVFLSVLLLIACSTHQKPSADEGRVERKATAADYNVQLGLGYLSSGNIQRAKKKLLTALEQAPQSADVNGAMGYYAEVTGDTELAKQYYKKAMRYARGQGSQLNNYGAFLCRQGNYQEAEKYFIAAVEDPDYLNAAGAYENAGLCAAAIPDLERAQYYFTRALKHDPRRPRSLLQLAEINYQQAEYQQALTYLMAYEKFMSLTARSALLGYNVASQSGQSEQARTYALLLSNEFPHSTEFQSIKAEKLL